jgi:hypothetical protein
MISVTLDFDNKTIIVGLTDDESVNYTASDLDKYLELYPDRKQDCVAAGWLNAESA